MDHEWRYISYQTWRCSIAILIFGGVYSQVQRQVESLIGQSSNRACAPASTAHTLSTLLKHPKSPGVFVQKKTSWRLHKSYTFALKIVFFSDMDTSNHLGAFLFKPTLQCNHSNRPRRKTHFTSRLCSSKVFWQNMHKDKPNVIPQPMMVGFRVQKCRCSRKTT